MLILIYLVKYKPMDDPSVNNFEIINEICVLLCSTIIISFTDFNTDNVDWVGWVYISFTGFLIAYTIITVFLLAMRLVIDKIKSMCLKKALKEPIGSF